MYLIKQIHKPIQKKFFYNKKSEEKSSDLNRIITQSLYYLQALHPPDAKHFLVQ